MAFCSTSKIYLFACTSFMLLPTVLLRKHQLVLENDMRRYFSVTTFGFFTNGQLEVNLNLLTFSATSEAAENAFGLTLTRTASDSITPYMESHQNKCLLLENSLDSDVNIEIISFLLDFKNNRVLVNCSKLSTSLEITGYSPNNSNIEISSLHSAEAPASRHLLSSGKESILKKSAPNDEAQIAKDLAVPENKAQAPEVPSKDTQPLAKQVAVSSFPKKRLCSSINIPFKKEIGEQYIKISNLKFIVSISTPETEGLFSLYFHNCAGNGKMPAAVNLSISIIEKNGENFLSAGEILLPRLYFILSVVFFFTGCIWVHVLKRKREETFKIHYLMSVLVFLKSLSLLFHGINFHIIAKDGYPMEAWAVLYYITHLLKGALLFITIVLIGTGWAFIKHILSDKDKKIFMIVIPLQVLANVAKIIMEESEEGESQHYTWREVFILVDLLCCGAILFPVVWSIRHLQEASQTDGKAAINLEKLKLFRHFYVMIVCYIYFTRIIVYLLKITVPFQYEWLDELFRETATLVFFIVTAYNFRPTTSNPYFRLPQDEELEIDEVITQTGFTEGVTKTVRSREFQGLDDNTTTTTKRESSHEYD